MRKLSPSEIVPRQIQNSRAPRLPLEVVLDNIRSLENVGSIFRTADGVGVRKLWLCGITGYPPQAGIAKAAIGAESCVPWEYQASARAVVERMKADSFQIVVLEQAEGALPVDDFVARKPLCLVIGNEVDGIADDVCALADAGVEIEMRGVKNSLNVAVAFGVAAHVLRRNLLSS